MINGGFCGPTLCATTTVVVARPTAAASQANRRRMSIGRTIRVASRMNASVPETRRKRYRHVKALQTAARVQAFVTRQPSCVNRMHGDDEQGSGRDVDRVSAAAWAAEQAAASIE